MLSKNNTYKLSPQFKPLFIGNKQKKQPLKNTDHENKIQKQ